jgi:hypothetical protein
VVFHKFFKDISYPTEREGFYRIDTVPVALQLPQGEEAVHTFTRQLYHMYLK